MSASNARPSASPKAVAPDLNITRIFDAPRALVFEVWAKPEHLVRWWGPKDFTLPVCNMDFRPGGIFSYIMRGPDGHDYPFDGEFLEIVEPERIVTRGTIHGDPGQEVTTIVTFADHERKTKLIVRQSYAFESEATRGAPIGWSQMLDCLADYLAGH
jgi:uncharacterized protein YndB with AHSA1/START domain